LAGRFRGLTDAVEKQFLDKMEYDGDRPEGEVVSGLRQSSIAALCALVVALALGACSKCDVPNLLPRHAAPQSCNDAPPQ